MKFALITTLIALAAAGLHAADAKKIAEIPKTDGTELPGGGKRWGVFSMEDAKKEAAKKKQPVAFVVVDERAEELALKDAQKTAFWGLEKECTMVVLPSNTSGQWKDRLPAGAYAGVTDKALGKELPKAVVMDTAVTAVIGTMTANQIIDGKEDAVKEFTKLMKDTNKDPAKIAAAAAAKPAAPATAPAPAAPAPGATPPATAATAPAAGPIAIKDAKPENWTNLQGRTIQATLLEVNGDSATLLLANGNKVPVPVSSLAAESQKRVEELKTASSK
jgi:hypothetical protein